MKNGGQSEDALVSESAIYDPYSHAYLAVLDSACQRNQGAIADQYHQGAIQESWGAWPVARQGRRGWREEQNADSCASCAQSVTTRAATCTSPLALRHRRRNGHYEDQYDYNGIYCCKLWVGVHAHVIIYPIQCPNDESALAK